MNSRERVLAAFEKTPADRVPVNYLANPAIDRKVKEYYGLGPRDTEGLYQKLGVDFRGINVRYIGPALHTPAEDAKIQVDTLWGWHTKYIEHENGGYWDYCDFPLKEADEEAVAAWPLPDPDDFDYSKVEETCAKYNEFAICFPCFGDFINANGMLRGMEQTLIDLVTDDPAGLLLAKRRFDIQIGMAERVLKAAKGRIDFVWMGEDLGTQDRQMISMDTFRKHILPMYEKYIGMVRSYRTKTMLHTCGSSSWAYDEFIRIGLDAVDTLQPECKDMSPRYLADHFGGRLSFHGCISTAGPLSFGTPADVRREIADVIEVMKPTKSYMMSPTHMIQDNSPVENVVELYEAMKNLGVY
jgi:hypothetical protein